MQGIGNFIFPVGGGSDTFLYQAEDSICDSGFYVSGGKRQRLFKRCFRGERSAFVPEESPLSFISAYDNIFNMRELLLADIGTFALPFRPRDVRLCAQNAEMMRDCSALPGWYLRISFRQDLQNSQDSNREHALGIWDVLPPVIPQGFTLLSC